MKLDFCKFYTRILLIWKSFMAFTNLSIFSCKFDQIKISMLFAWINMSFTHDLCLKRNDMCSGFFVLALIYNNVCICVYSKHWLDKCLRYFILCSIILSCKVHTYNWYKVQNNNCKIIYFRSYWFPPYHKICYVFYAGIPGHYAVSVPKKPKVSMCSSQVIRLVLFLCDLPKTSFYFNHKVTFVYCSFWTRREGV